MTIAQVQIRPGGALEATRLTDLVLGQGLGSTLSATNPWPGLATNDEASAHFFKGRASETAELLRLIRLAPLTVLYGNSGLGKSSLLQAGVFPELRKQHFLPVYLRVDFSPSAERSPFEQVAARLETEITATGAEAAARSPGEDLWRYLHRSDLEVWSSDSFLLTPVLVFDQFEEVFSRSADDTVRVQHVFNGLADLIENRIPADLADERTGHARYDLLGQRYRIVLAFREDFLPEIDSWKDRVPSLLRNRMRLLPMARGDAVAAVQTVGAAVLADGMAEKIVDFVGHGAAPGPQRALTVEPVLLSLCCAQLNRRRAKEGLIDDALLARAGDDILESFYSEALQGLPERVPRFIEEHLVQGTRFRGSYPRDEALAEGKVTEPELSRLTGVHRLLRIEHQADTARIELIHDRLVSVVRKARDERLRLAREAEQQRIRERAENDARRERELREASEKARDRERRLRLKLVSAVALMLVAMVSMAWFAVQADLQEKSARTATQNANALRLIAESQAMLAGLRAGGDERALQQLLAGHRLAPPLSAPVDGAMLDAVVGSSRMLRVIDQGSTVTCVALSPDGTRIVSGSDDNTLRLWDANSGQPIGAPLAGHKDSVWSVAFSPDGMRIVSGSGDHTLRLWDARSGQPIGAPLVGHKSSVSSVAFSPDGMRIVSGKIGRAHV